MSDGGVAIVGVACRFPGAPDLGSFERLLWDGVDAVTETPADRWSKAFFHDADPRQAGKSYTFAAGVLEHIDRFDAGFFGVSPREAMHIDPQQRLLLELAYEATEDAGLPLAALAGRDVGVFVGASSFDYLTHRAGDVSVMDAHSMQGLALSSISNRVSYAFDLHGPSLTVDTACSSSLVALHLACEAIRRGEAPLALVGGVNLLIAPQAFIGFSRAAMLSPTGRCHAFDSRADGYVRSEGGAVVVLKPLADALADGDEIRGVIRATGVNSDGRTTGLSLPSREAQARLLRDVYARAGVEADSLSYLEAHGTGTPVGDPIEAAAIGDALGRGRATPLPIGSVKTNIGHLEAASGMAGLLKVLLTLQRGEAPPSLHLRTPNPNIPFAEHNLALTPAATPLSPGPDGLVAGVNSFGFGGTNAHAVLLAAPARSVGSGEAESPPLLLSARDEDALRMLAQGWRDRLRQPAPADGHAAALRGAARRREHHAHRLVAWGGGASRIADDLDAWLAGRTDAAIVTGQAINGRLAFVFSGNGSQWAGMGRAAFANNAVFRTAVAEIDAALEPQIGWSVANRLGAPLSAADLADTTIAQPMLFAVQAASVRALAEAGVSADAFVGHSVGEVAAAWAAGALTLTQACQVVAHRSRLQGLTRGQGGMAALGLSAEAAADALAELAPALVVAAVNSPTSVTVSGPHEALVDLERAARSRRWLFSRLDLDYAFHSPAMDAIRGPLLDALALLRSAEPRGLLVSSVTGQPVSAGQLNADYWWRNVREPVLFGAGVEQVVAGGARLHVEIGPQPILQSYLRDALRQSHGRALTSLAKADPADADPFVAIAARCHVAGVDISAAPVFDGPSTARGLPAYPWSRQRHWLGRTSEGVELNALASAHPLLGFRRDESEPVWFNHLSTTRQPWLADHQVDGAVVLPAAAMIDMALAAARSQHPDAPVLELADLEISRPILLDGGAREVRLSVTSATGGFGLQSRPRLSDEALVTHARGRLSAGARSAGLLQLAAPAGEGRTLDAAAFYGLTRGLKLQYGPAFQTVASATTSGGDYVEVTFAPAEDDDVAAGAMLDPTVLDGALQGLAALHGPASGDVTAVPWRFGRVRLLQPGVRPARAQVQLRAKGPRAVSADILLLDASGGTVAELTDCWLVSVNARRALGERDRRFWTAQVPTLRQPEQPPPAGLFEAAAAAVSVQAEPAQTVLLAEAFALAAAQEAMQAIVGGADRVFAPDLLAFEGGIAPASREMFDRLLASLAAEGVVVAEDGRWRFEPEAALPDSTLIWRSLLAEAPAAVAELSLAAASAEALTAVLRDGPDGRPEPSPTLVQQMLFASPTGVAASRAVEVAVDAIAAGWPARRPLRLALVGALEPAFVARLADRLAERDVALRLTLFVGDEDGAASLASVLSETPGAETATWSDDATGTFDVVAGLHPFSGPDAVDPAAAAALLGPGGLLLAAEPQSGELWPLALGRPVRMSGLAALGFDRIEVRSLAGEVWSAALILARRGETAAERATRGMSEVLILAAPDDDLASGVALALAEAGRALASGPLEALGAARSKAAAGREVVAIAPAGGKGLATLCAQIASAVASLATGGDRLWLVATDDVTAAALEGLRRVAANEAPELDVRTVSLHPALDGPAKAARLASDLADPGTDRALVHTAEGRFTPRLRLGGPARPPAPRGPRRLHVERPGLLGSLGWTPITPPAPGPGEVAIAVGAAGLNFRDVMWAAGLLPDEALLHGFAGPGFGLECSGVVTALGAGVDDLRLGQRVVAVAPAALATHAVTKRHAVLAVPDGVDLTAAATLPVAFLTAVYALGRLARLERGERVLIHGGAGGVGLAAIQYAQHLGAEVFATAGSPVKRELLRRLGVDHVLDSRSAAFADAVLEATGGEGVDVVLNSLSDDLMQHSLRLLRPFGRFLEIGKRDLFGNTEVGLRPLRHNASYFAIDVDQLAALKPTVAGALFGEIEVLLAAGVLRPLPHRAFAFDAVTDAFRLMQGSGHIGKIVLVPEPAAAETAPEAAPSVRVHADRSYVVTGGLSGFGLESARWLARQGARHLALVSRRGPVDPSAVSIIAEFARAGVEATAMACDVADRDALGIALEAIRAAAPIGGVVHAAAVIEDGLLPGLDAERFDRALRPKAEGAANLDLLTRDDPVELFLLHTSVSAAVGNPGQAAYVVANAAMEAVAERRRAGGLPATAVQWGPIADAGYLTRETRVREVLDQVLGGGELTARAALDALPALMSNGLAVPGFADVDWSVLRRRLPIGASTLFADLPAADALDAAAGALGERLLALSDDEAHALVLDVLVEETAAILRLPRSRVDVQRPLADIGCDSLMAVELRLAIEARLGGELPLLSVGDGAALQDMSRRIVRSLRGDAPAETALAEQIGRHESADRAVLLTQAAE